MHNDYYVYLHRRGDNNEVFYIGKGRGYRAKTRWGRNRWWTAIVTKHGFTVEFVEKGMTEDDAHTLEIETIKFYRECNHPICNLCEGGEGTSGAVRKQPIVDGAEIDLNIIIDKRVPNKTGHWKLRINRLALNIVIQNLLTHRRIYYSRGKNKAEKSDNNIRGLSNHCIKAAAEYIVKKGFATSVVSKTTDSVKTLSYVEATQELYDWWAVTKAK